MSIFKRFKRNSPELPEKEIAPKEAPEPIAEEPVDYTPTAPEPPEDNFTEWCRSQIRGGIERRERNDIFEEYNVFGSDPDGNLICRRYHRYPEHDRDFGLSYSRTLTFDEFNRRLLSELDKGDLKFDEYHSCIGKAQPSDAPDTPFFCGFTDEETAVLHSFCENADTLINKSYLHENGVYRCECTAAVGDERLAIRFRKPLPHDALNADISGVGKEEIGGYDIDDLWIMGVYNRIRENCASCRVIRLTSLWNLEKESVYLIFSEGFSGIEGALLTAVGEASQFKRFGFYSLDFSKK